MNKEWSKYLENLSWIHSDVVRQLWSKLIALVPNLRIPQTGLIPDETSFCFAWDNKDNYLDIEVFPDATFEWFYRNRNNNTLAGSEEAINIIDDTLIDYLHKYAT